MAEGNAYVNQLLDKKAEISLLQKKLDTELKCLEAKLANAKKTWVDVDKAWDEAVNSKSTLEVNLAKVK